MEKSSLERAISVLRAGKPIVVFDSAKREREADIMVHAKFASAKMLRMLRTDAGGLVCLATKGEVAKKLGLPFLADAYVRCGLGKLVYMKTKYGDKPAFSIAVNHRGTYTGITDNDRSLSAREFEKIAAGILGRAEFGKIAAGEWGRKEFEKEFKAPGHLQLLIGKSLEERRGHTELGLALCERAGLSPAILMCEMLGKGKALSNGKAKAYAKKNKIVFIEGSEIYGKE
ncbi:3,4-dihydroxy-2-butanone 4-phosphate synthase [Candidatus Anstonella stagnisolia]|nr:3,4-dihydroxy-2-butanone 4-phosphate synthase [Candidatus Anstonella stagnisolia]